MNGEQPNNEETASQQIWKIQSKRLNTTRLGNPYDLCGWIDTSSGVWKQNFLLSELILTDDTVDVLRKERFAGLVNLGSTCYVNSFVQALYFNQDFKSTLLSIDVDANTTVHELQSLIADLELSVLGKVSPVSFLESMQIRTNLQEDTGEFGTLLLNWLDQQIGGNRIRSIFEGIMSHRVSCTSCPYVSHSQERFLELHMTPDMKRISEGIFGHEELVEGYRCGQASCTSNPSPSVMRSSTVSSVPRRLRIVVDRYRYSYEYGREKISSGIDIPTKLNFQNNQFICTGILEHHSDKASSGHYTATLRDPLSGEWWLLDDTKVERIDTSKRKGWSETSCSSTTAYVVLYDLVVADSPSHIYPSVLDKVREQAEARNQAIIHDIEQKKATRARIEQAVNERKRIVQELLDFNSKPVVPPVYSIDSNFLKAWSCGEDLRCQFIPLIGGVLPDSSPSRCEHNNLSPMHLEKGLIKFVPFQIGESAVVEICNTCKREFDDQTALGLKYWDLLRRIQAAKYNVVVRKFDDESLDDHEAVWVYKPYIPNLHASLRKALSDAKSLKERMGASGGERSKIDICGGVLCEHGIIVPEATDVDDFVLKPKTLILELVDISGKLRNDWFGFLPEIEIPVATVGVENSYDTCEACQKGVSEESALKSKLKEWLSESQGLGFEPGHQYYVFPASWVSRVKSWATGNSRALPKGLRMDSLVCQHGDLKIDVLNKIGRGEKLDGISILSEKVVEILRSPEFTKICKLPDMLVVIERDRSFTLGVCPILCSLCEETRKEAEKSVISIRVFHEPLDRLDTGNSRPMRAELNGTVVIYKPGRSRQVGTTPAIEPHLTGLDLKLGLLEIGILEQTPFEIHPDDALHRINLYLSHPSIRGSLVQILDEYPIIELMQKFQSPDSSLVIDTVFVEFTRNASAPSSPKRQKRVPSASDHDAGMQGSILRSPS